MKFLNIKIIFFFFAIGLVLISFKPKPSDMEENEIFTQQLEILKDNINRGEDIIPSFLEVRKVYKTMEWKLEYLSYQWQEYFNGSPVSKVNPYTAGTYEKKPHGLQVLEEMICDNADKEVVLKEVNQLIHESKRVREYLHQSAINSLQLVEAIQLALIRWQTLTIMGFEHPSLANEHSLNEAAYVFHILAELIQKETGSGKTFKAGESKEIKLLLSQIEKTVKQSTFDSLDRFNLLVHVLPLLNADLEKVKERYTYQESHWFWNSPVFLGAKNIFSKDFINPDIFSGFGRNKSNTAIEHLGKIIFFDPLLSKNNQLSCATCHQPDKYFADGLIKSISAEANHFLARNTPTLLYTGYQTRWMYSMQALRLEDQMDHVIVNHKEFGTSYTEIVEKMRQSSNYWQLFNNAFPELEEPVISVYSINLSVAAYVRSLAPFNSEFDEYVNQINEVNKEVQKGFNLFSGKGKCATCHFVPMFNGLLPPHYIETEAEVLGLYQVGDTTQLDDDLGRYLSTPLQVFKRAFKTPTIRNVAMTAPYGHNGCFPDLESIMIFYNHGGGLGYGFDVDNQTLPEEQLNLSSEEIRLIIRFMESLTDRM